MLWQLYVRACPCVCLCTYISCCFSSFFFFRERVSRMSSSTLRGSLAYRGVFFFSRHGLVPFVLHVGQTGWRHFASAYIASWERKHSFSLPLFASSVSSFRSTFLGLLQSANFILFLHCWLLRLVATAAATTSVASEVSTFFRLATRRAVVLSAPETRG